MTFETVPIKGLTIRMDSGGTVEITDNTPVSLGDGFSYRRLTYRDDTAEIVFEVHDGWPGAVSFTLSAGEDGFIRQKDLTAIRLDQIRDEVYAVAGIGAFTPDGDEYEHTGADARKALNRVTSRRKLTPEFLTRVAEIYQAAPDGRRIEAVRAAFGIEERQALRYIARAKSERNVNGND
jgi:hypothetical protein